METAKIFEAVFSQLKRERDEKNTRPTAAGSLMLEIAKEVARETLARRTVAGVAR